MNGAPGLHHLRWVSERVFSPFGNIVLVVVFLLSPVAVRAQEHVHAETGSEQSEGLRDPHTYSDGYTLTSGPYTLNRERSLHLADEMVFWGMGFDRMERGLGSDSDPTVFAAHLWAGNSYEQLLMKIEGELESGSVESTTTEFLWSHAVSPFWDLRPGIRLDSGEAPDRQWLGLGIHGLAPYWFTVDVSAYLGEQGRSTFNLEATYEMLLTQRLVLEPRVELNAFGKGDSERRTGSGFSDAAAGVRLRYEFSRRFAPYVGVEWRGYFGGTADLLPPGTDEHETRLMAGLRFWF
ncbi:MAG: copper resistance protein B [Pseudohongiellaceae bacterium]